MLPHRGVARASIGPGSLGKQWLGLRIVRVDGSRATFVRAVLLRMLLPWLLAWIPFVGWFLLPVDWLVIFREDCRCLHDLIAGTKVVVVPGAGRISSGPYRYLRHPNYVAVVAEGIALPLVHTAWLTAVIFSVLNAALLRVRIRSEAGALAMLGRA